MNEASAGTPPFDYDNGICNNDNGDPATAAGAPEDGGNGGERGLRELPRDMATRDYASLYGTAATTPRHGVDRPVH